MDGVAAGQRCGKLSRVPGSDCRAGYADRVDRRAFLPLVLVLGVPLFAACADAAGPNGKFCDVAKRLQVTANPLSGNAYFTDPKLLGEGMTLRVSQYTDLALVAPTSVRTDAIAARDGLAQIALALKDKGNKASAANEEPLAGLILAQRTSQSEANLARFITTACKESA